MKVPSYLRPYAAEYSEFDCSTSIILADSRGGRLFEIWIYGEYDEQYQTYAGHRTGEKLIGTYTDENGVKIQQEFEYFDGKLKFVAKSVTTGEEILVFDQTIHGYDAMFCLEYNDPGERPLIKLDIPPSEICVYFSYYIDYDSEKDTFDFDDDDKCILNNGDAIPWEQVKTDGIDWITIGYNDENGSYTILVDMELS